MDKKFKCIFKIRYFPNAMRRTKILPESTEQIQKSTKMCPILAICYFKNKSTFRNSLKHYYNISWKKIVKSHMDSGNISNSQIEIKLSFLRNADIYGTIFSTYETNCKNNLT